MGILKDIGKSVLEILLFTFFTVVIAAVLMGIITATQFIPMGGMGASGVNNPYEAVLYPFIPLCIATVASTIIVHKVIYNRSLRFSGFGIQHAVSEFSIGAGWSIVAIGLGFCMLVLINMLDIVAIDMNAYLFFGFIILFIFQSGFEEIVCRSFLLPTIAHRLNLPAGLILSSIFFGLMHWSNDHMSVLSIINLIIAGVLLGVIYLRYRTIWGAIGLHAGWNFFQGSFFGFEVSGIDVYSLIDTKEVGPDIITGGQFGFEGSILATFLMAILISLIWREAPHVFRGEYLPSDVTEK